MTLRLRILFLAVTVSVAAPAWAQKTSLADRVARLEQVEATQTQGAGQANVELLNRLTQLQSEVQDLRNQIEQLQNDNEQLKQRNREQYVDLDTRLQRLEGGGAGASAPAQQATGPMATAATDNASKPVVPSTPALSPADEQSLYATAFDALKHSDYVASARGFKAYLQGFPQGGLAPNAWYWLGESYYVTQNYQVAQQAFESLLKQFPDSGKAADALLKKGYCQLEMKQFEPGRLTLQQVSKDYPGTDAARLAQARLRMLSLESH